MLVSVSDVNNDEVFDIEQESVAHPVPTEDAEEEESEEKRTGWHWVIPVVLVAALVFAPWIISVLVPANAAGWTVVAAYLALTAVLSFVDARGFRPSWTLPILVGVATWVASRMYFNDGAWIYIPIFMVVAWGLGKLGGRGTR
ncbi:hypothetical protein HMPREF2559_04140 [Corynebacterium sp. HMSC072G08]|nr:hypothetical protein HMPREF2559_04140 [Corynebacterium sp. HMSC072G08]